MSQIYRGVVIGLGNIGQGYDRNGDNMIQTHAQAFFSHKSFELIGGVDPDILRRREFTARFGVPAHATISEMRVRSKIDVVSIATPTAQHRSTFDEVIHLRPKAIICEKPIAPLVKDAEEMIEIARAQNSLLVVNYLRRFDPTILDLKKRFQQREFGDVHKGVVWYSKGLLNNGSHFIDLLSFLIGEPTGFKILNIGREYPAGDCEPDVMIYFGVTPVMFLAGREEEISLKSIELMTEKALIRYLAGGARLEIVPANRKGLFSQQSVLASESLVTETEFLKHYQWYVLEDLCGALTHNLPLKSTGESALNTLKVVSQIMTTRQE